MTTPIRRPASGSPSAEARFEGAPDQQQLRRKREGRTVLVVDDQPAGRYATCRMLKARGYDTLETGSGVDALAMAFEADAVVLDVNLPDMNGVQVCGILRGGQSGQAGRPHIPLILHSAVYADDLHREAAMTSGADAYLFAPFKHEDVIELLDRLLGLS